jgi:hypothetical protein
VNDYAVHPVTPAAKLSPEREQAEAPMDRFDLKKWQIDKMDEPIRKGLRYLCELNDRMDKVGWGKNDSLYLKILAARKAMAELRQTLGELGEQKPATYAYPDFTNKHER